MFNDKKKILDDEAAYFYDRYKHVFDVVSKSFSKLTEDASSVEAILENLKNAYVSVADAQGKFQMYESTSRDFRGALEKLEDRCMKKALETGETLDSYGDFMNACKFYHDAQDLIIRACKLLHTEEKNLVGQAAAKCLDAVDKERYRKGVNDLIGFFMDYNHDPIVSFCKDHDWDVGGTRLRMADARQKYITEQAGQSSSG